jgi:protein involved in polysaccharide export with SLBB domain
MPLALEAPVFPDDIIVAGQMQKFYVTGEVKTPGRFLFEPGLTVQKAISMAGGLSEKGDPEGVKLTRLGAVVKTVAAGADTAVQPDDIVVVEGQNRKFYVSGEVKAPGGYSYRDGLTVQKAIVMAGGLGDKAEKNKVKIVRQVNGKEETVPADMAASLLPEDTIVVPEGQKFYVSGEVKTPGRYLYERGLTVQRAVSMAGGLTERADPAGLKVTRPKDTGIETGTVALDAAVLPDDIIVVEGQIHKIYVSGEVRMPGGYPFKEGLNVQKALAMAGGFSEKAEKNLLKLVRQVNGREEILQATLTTQVLPEDTIIIPEGQKFYVTGEVKTPGRYLFEQGLTVQKALSMAGGMTDKADPAGVKLTRPKANGVEMSTVSPEAVVLPDDILVVEGQIHKFYVSGEVRVPGSYSYKEGLTVQKALAMAGGQSDKAEKGALKIVRKAEGREETLPATLATNVLPEDTIVVPEGQKFYVSGEVKTPGRYLFEPGLTVQKALSMAGGMTDKADKADIKINRLEDGIVRTVVLDVHALIQPNDVLVVAQAQKIYVEGEVKHPGYFPYEKGMTVHMAIAMAGGFTDKASQNGTKILRNLNGQEQSERAKLDGPVQPNDIIVVPQRFF